MDSLASDIRLNVSIHLVLISVLITIFHNVLQEWRTERQPEGQSLLCWVSSYMLYVCLSTFTFLFPGTFVGLAAKTFAGIVSALVFFFLGNWILMMARSQTHVPDWLFWTQRVCVIGITIGTYIVYYLFKSTLFYFVILALFYLLTSIVLIRYRAVFGTHSIVMMLMTFLLEYLSNLQSRWPITPENVVATVFLVGIYLQLWQGRLKHNLRVEKELAETEAALQRSRTEVTLTQIQPHFIYNTLSTISALCEIDPKKAQKVTEDFSDYLRVNLNMGKVDMLSPFTAELAHTETYLSIEKVRFGDHLHIEYNIQEEGFMLPSLTLQPLVENAVKHGVTQRKNGGTIRISSASLDEDVVVVVEDDGVGFDSSIPIDETKHYGLKCTRDRLETLLGGSLEIRSTPGVGTKATIRLKRRKTNT